MIQTVRNSILIVDARFASQVITHQEENVKGLTPYVKGIMKLMVTAFLATPATICKEQSVLYFSEILTARNLVKIKNAKNV